MLSRNQLIETLQERMKRIEWGPDGRQIHSGAAALDNILPRRGFRRGSLVEWLGSAGGGATTLAAIAAREACRDGRALVVVDVARRFYPPAAAMLGILLESLIVICPGRRDLGWALNQTLACPAVGAVLCWPDTLDGRAFRRLQLSAEVGGGLGLLVRPATVAGSPSWADVRLLVEGAASESDRRFRVTLLRCRGAIAGQAVELELDDENTLRLASELADPTPRQRATGA
jgi:protein ImuA